MVFWGIFFLYIYLELCNQWGLGVLSRRWLLL